MSTHYLVNVYDRLGNLVEVKDLFLAFPYGEELAPDAVIFLNGDAFRISGNIVQHSNLTTFSIRPVQAVNLENNKSAHIRPRSLLTGTMTSLSMLSDSVSVSVFGDRAKQK